MDKLDEASDALKQKLYEKVKVAQESGTELVSKRVEATDWASWQERIWIGDRKRIFVWRTHLWLQRREENLPGREESG